MEVEIYNISQQQHYMPIAFANWVFTSALDPLPVGFDGFEVKSHRPGATPKAILHRGFTTTDPGLASPKIFNNSNGGWQSLGLWEGGPIWLAIVDVNTNVNSIYNLRWRERIPE